MTRVFFSGPAITRMIPSSSSVCVISRLPLRAERRAASLTRFERSAPVKPGVWPASASTSMSFASGLPRVWTSRIFARPLRSGRSTTTWRSKRPGRNSAGSRMSGRLVAAIRMMLSFISKPSISTSSWFSVCSRQQRLTGAGRAVEQHALRDARAERLELLGVLEELLDLVQLLDRLVHAGDVAEGDLGRVDRQPLGARLAERHDLRAAALHLVHQEDPEPDEDQEGGALEETAHRPARDQRAEVLRRVKTVKATRGIGTIWAVSRRFL